MECKNCESLATAHSQYCSFHEEMLGIKTPDTNQASEDKLDEILEDLVYDTPNSYGYPPDFEPDFAKAKKELLDWHNKHTLEIIGEDEYSGEYSFDETPYDTTRNELRDELRQKLKRRLRVTNYNERLDEILSDYADEHRNHAYEFDNKEISQYEYFKSMRNDKEKAKQAITSLINEAVKSYEDNLLSTIDDISNKPWRAARHIRELYENSDSGDGDWYKEVADDWRLLEEFFSNDGMGKVRELMADPDFNVNYPERIAKLEQELEKYEQ